MKIFFGEANLQEFPDVDQREDLFLNPENRKYYFYMIHVSEDGNVQLMDTCNRMVPFDISQVEELSDAAYFLREIQELRANVAQDLEDGIADIIDTTNKYTGVRVLV